MGLTVAGAALLTCGLMLVLVGSTLHLKSPHDGRGFVHAGEAVAVCGLAVGIGVLVMLIMDLADRAGRGGPGHARQGPGPQLASEGLTPLPSPEPGLAQFRQDPVVEFRLASRYPRPGHADTRWQPDAGNASYPHPGSGPDQQAGGGWSPGPAYVWGTRDDWGSAEGGWSPAEPDNWAGDDRAWGPAGQGDWGQGGQPDQQEWAAAAPGGWGSPGQDGWGQGGQQQWAPDGQGDWDQGGQPGRQEWAAAGQDEWAGDDRAWGPAGQGDWGQGGQPDQQEWAAAAPGGWGSPGQDGWSQGGWTPPGQDGWGQGGQRQWAPDGQGDWDQGGQPGHQEWAGAGQDEWAAAGQSGWMTGADHDWGAAEPAASQASPVTNSAESGEAGAFDDTAPIPVIRDAGPPGPKTAEDEPAPRKSVFEPAPKKSVFEPGPKKAPEHDRGSDRDGHPDEADRGATAEPLPAETQAKLEQIKDLYMTAEAIGEDALVKHFDQLSQRQRSLIREFFEQSGLGSSRTSALLGDDGSSPPNGASTQDGASLPG